ncbi:FxSxx-COOH system tetratricopeptide repeat protein [Micromonospora carbonacea]|uniref:FxSxx-COOH system tetratricopeptide repeat protein n=1 Tax=Micromonospora carbonacea TaxID=47853 RepID=UPI003318D731
MGAGVDGGRIVTFYSYKGGTGRSMALANVAWILASNGKRVLVVDWDLEAPGLHRYFHPFLPDKEASSTPGLMDMLWNYATAVMDSAQTRHDRWRESYADVLEHVVSLRWPFEHGGVIDLLTAGAQDRSYATRVSSFDWGNFYDRLHGGSFVEEMKRSMRGHYDYVLVDSRTGLNDTSGICTVQIPDTLVMCFTMSSQSIIGALAVADSVLRQRRADDLLILPVPMRVEDGETSRLEAGRSYIRSAFRRFLRGRDADGRERYWGDVEIPYKVYYAYEEILATVGDRPHQEGSLLAAYERLTSQLTDGRVSRLVPLEDADREMLIKRFRRSVNRRGLYDFFISHERSDQRWAEWIAMHLEQVGYRVWLPFWDVVPGTRWSEEIEKALLASDVVLALLSPAAVRAEETQHEWQLARNVDPGGESGRLVPVEVVNCAVPRMFRDVQGLRLADCDEATARSRLLMAVQQIQPPSGGHLYHRERRSPASFPGRPPEVSNLPPRPRHLVGRDDEVFALWSGFREANAPIQAVCGLAGVGKTVVALEYAHRFSHEYAVVWWIPAGGPQHVADGLTGLAEALGLAVGPAEAESRLRDELSRRGRALLVLDNADVVDEPVFAMPESVNVLVTSRRRGWGTGVVQHDLGVLSIAEAKAMLRNATPSLPESTARETAELLGGLPLALAMVSSDSELGSSLRHGTGGVGGRRNERGGYGKVLAPFWSWASGRLAEEAPAAVELMRIVAFFAPEPVPLSLLTDTPAAVDDVTLREALAGATAGEAAFTDLLGALHRYGLVEPEGDCLRLHRLVQAAVREGLDLFAEAALRRQGEQLLVSARLGDPSDPRNWPRYAQVVPHVLAADWAQGPALRGLVLLLCGYLSAAGETARARALATTVSDRFTSLLGGEHVDTVAAMHVLAAVTWADGDHKPASAVALRVLELRRRVLGEAHPETLAAMNNLAVMRWSSGQHDEALALNEDLLRRRQALLGPDHPDTVVALGNRAVILCALGRFDEALDCERRVHHLRSLALGDRHPVALASLGNIATLEARRWGVEAAVATYEHLAAACRESLGADHPETLRAQFQLSRTLLRSGDAAAARRLLDATLEQQRQRLGPDHPDVRASRALLTELTQSRDDG